MKNITPPTLLDHYAAAALTGLLAAGRELKLDELAETAFEMANAMLDARKRLQGQPA